MAPIRIPETGTTFQGAGREQDAGKDTNTPAILLRLTDALVEDMRVAAQHKRLHFDAGKAPKLRLGTKTIDLSLSPSASKHELYLANSSLSTLTYSKLITHQAHVNAPEKDAKGTAGADAALASLKANIASFAQDKEANQVAISRSLQATPKNRHEAAKTHKQVQRSLLSGGAASPSMGGAGTPRGLAPTSQPLSDDQVKLKAMRVPVIHLLAMRPMKLESIAEKTRAGKEDLEGILRKVGQEREGKWELVNRSYKELDVWGFKYPSQEDRQAAVDNAIKAFDRLRVGKEEKVWQLLLKPEERGKGKTLSRLHLGAAAGGSTPGLGTSPLPAGQGSQAGSTVGTPVVGAASKSAATKKHSEQMKRMLSKDPQKARAAEEAKARKRKEREATASDVEGRKAAKKQASSTVKGPPAKKIKSAELVHSSDDEDDEECEVKEKAPPLKSKPSPAKAAVTTKAGKPKASSSDSSDVPVKQAKAVEKLQVSKRKDTPEASPAAKPAKPAPVTGKSTPRTNGLKAPSNKSRHALSPQKPDSRPYAPSPLGAARPRIASDVSDRNAVGVQRTKNAGGNTGTPQRHGVSSQGARKRQDTVTSATSSSSNGPEPRSSSNESSQDKARKAVPKSAASTSSASVAKPVAPSKDETSRNTTKRKRDDEPNSNDDTTTKHRKTDSSSTRSSTSTTNSTATGSKPSPRDEAVFDSGSSDAAGSSASSAIVGDNRDSTMSFRQAVSVAQNFKAYYPAYEELWEKLDGMRERGEVLPEKEVSRLWVMQERLAEMKRDIQEASRGRDGG